MTKPAADVPTPAAREGLPPALHARVQRALLDSGYFSSEGRMRGLFADARIAPWRDALPHADDPADLVRRVAACLHQHYSVPPEDENALVLLLHVLRDNIDPADALHGQLAGLADDLARALKGAIFICYTRHAELDRNLARHLYETLTAQAYRVFLDETMRTGTAWLDEIDRQIQASDFLIVLLSEASVHSEMVRAEVKRAYDYRRQQGHPQTLPVRIAYEGLLPYAIDAFLNPLQYIVWQSDADTARVMQDILAAVKGQLPDRAAVQATPMSPFTTASEDGHIVGDTQALPPPSPEFDPRVLESLTAPGGAVRLRDKLYIARKADADLKREIVRPGTLVTIRAARQTGKSSLLVRGLYHARQRDIKTITLDLQFVDEDYLASRDTFLRYLAEFVVRELRLDLAEVRRAWQSEDGPQVKLTYLMQDYVLPQVDARIVLALDEVDCLLETPFHSDFFALMRAWYNRVAYDFLWEKLNLVLVISTEPFLLIQDMNQSPFNVGLTLDLKDFDAAQVRDLNVRHGSPLREHELPELTALLGGHPYLIRKALYTLVTTGQLWPQLAEVAASDRGPFRDHLRRYHWLLRDQPDLQAAMRQVLRDKACTDDAAFYRLLRAGLVKGSGEACRYRCDLYRQYFESRL